MKHRVSALETNVLCHLLRPDVDPRAHHVIGSKDLPRDKDKMKTFVGSFILLLSCNHLRGNENVLFFSSSSCFTSIATQIGIAGDMCMIDLLRRWKHFSCGIYFTL